MQLAVLRDFGRFVPIIGAESKLRRLSFHEFDGEHSNWLSRIG